MSPPTDSNFGPNTERLRYGHPRTSNNSPSSIELRGHQKSTTAASMNDKYNRVGGDFRNRGYDLPRLSSTQALVLDNIVHVSHKKGKFELPRSINMNQKFYQSQRKIQQPNNNTLNSLNTISLLNRM